MPMSAATWWFPKTFKQGTSTRCWKRYCINFLVLDKLCLVSALKNESHNKSDLKRLFRSPLFNSSHRNGRIRTPEVCSTLYSTLPTTQKRHTRSARSQATCWSLPYLPGLGCIPSAARDVEHGASLGILEESWSPEPFSANHGSNSPMFQISIDFRDEELPPESFFWSPEKKTHQLSFSCWAPSPPFWLVGVSFFTGLPF